MKLKYLLAYIKGRIKLMNKIYLYIALFIAILLFICYITVTLFQGALVEDIETPKEILQGKQGK